MPTSSPSRLTTGLPELPPMMSAVQTKFIGVSRFRRSLRSSQLLRQGERLLAAVLLGAVVRAGERRPGGHLLAVLAVTLDQSERQPQRERGVGIGFGAEEGEADVGQLAVGRALRLFDLLLDRSCGPCGPARRPAGPAGSSGRRRLRWP